MSCTVCGGCRDGEGIVIGIDIRPCERTDLCISAAPQYFTKAERAALIVRAKLGPRGRSCRQTRSGRTVYPLDPQPGDLHIEDIATGLAGMCRFGGMTRKHYSVAEHSLIVSYYVDPDYARQALLHDAAEAITGVDMPGPLKRDERLSFWRELEDRLQEIIFARFHVVPTLASVAAVHDVDSRLLHDELAVAMGSTDSWGMTGEPLGAGISFFDRDTAKRLFLKRFRELFPEENIHSVV